MFYLATRPDGSVQLRPHLYHARLLASGILGLLDHQPRSHLPAPSKVDEPNRKSTRLNSSHVKISYAVFCLKKKKAPMCIHYQTIYERLQQLIVQRFDEPE